MLSKLERLQKEYLDDSRRDKSEVYALIGAFGVFPKRLTPYEALKHRLRKPVHKN